MQVEQIQYSYRITFKSLPVLLTIAVAHATEELSPASPRSTQTQNSHPATYLIRGLSIPPSPENINKAID